MVSLIVVGFYLVRASRYRDKQQSSKTGAHSCDLTRGGAKSTTYLSLKSSLRWKRLVRNSQSKAMEPMRTGGTASAAEPATSPDSIPVLDVLGLSEKEADLQSLAKQIKSALTQIGFVAIVNHNVSTETVSVNNEMNFAGCDVFSVNSNSNKEAHKSHSRVFSGNSLCPDSRTVVHFEPAARAWCFCDGGVLFVCFSRKTIHARVGFALRRRRGGVDSCLCSASTEISSCFV